MAAGSSWDISDAELAAIEEMEQLAMPPHPPSVSLSRSRVARPPSTGAADVSTCMGNAQAARLQGSKQYLGKVELALHSDDKMALSLSGHPIVEKALRQVRGGFFDTRENTFIFPHSQTGVVLRQLKQLSADGHQIETVDLPPQVRRILDYCVDVEKRAAKPFDSDFDYLPRVLKTAIRPFQKQGVKYAIDRRGRVLLADEMGLGKTVQALALAWKYRQEWPLLIITPATLRLSWRDAVLEWLPDVREKDIQVISKASDVISDAQIVIGSYGVLAQMVVKLSVHSFKLVVCDESHYLKNGASARSKALLPLLKSAKRALLLTGTPALSRPVELYTQLSAIAPNLFRGFLWFAHRYCAARQTNFGLDSSGCSNGKELGVIVRRLCMIRRLKSQVLSQLPSKIRHVIHIQPQCSKQDLAGVKRLLNVFDSSTEADVLSVDSRALTTLYYKSALVKAKAVAEYVRDTAESGAKFLAFYHHKVVGDTVAGVLKDIPFIRIDGSTSPGQRLKLVKQFQEDGSVRVAVLSITACGTGISLTAADTVVFTELTWTPGQLLQAEDRIHRIGQRRAVNVKYLLAAETVDDRIWKLIERKIRDLGETLDRAPPGGATLHKKEPMDGFERPIAAHPPDTKMPSSGDGAFAARGKEPESKRLVVEVCETDDEHSEASNEDSLKPQEMPSSPSQDSDILVCGQLVEPSVTPGGKKSGKMINQSKKRNARLGSCMECNGRVHSYGPGPLPLRCPNCKRLLRKRRRDKQMPLRDLDRCGQRSRPAHKKAKHKSK